ncbi:MAG: FkbM family methyltransferase, partial [Candidatus Methanosuratincola petrocarbonis]
KEYGILLAGSPVENAARAIELFMRKRPPKVIVVGDFTLKTLIDHGFVPDLIEGAEYEVLEGLSQTLETCRPKLIVEIFEKNQEKVFNLMSKFGYKWKEISKQNFLFYT